MTTPLLPHDRRDGFLRDKAILASKARQALLISTTIVAISSPIAEGFRNSAPGAYGLARSGGRMTQIEDATAATHNPANLVELEQAEFIFAPTFVHIKSELTLTSGLVAKTEDPWKVLPNLFASSPINDQMALGLAVTTPYGLSNEWENSGAFASPAGLRYATPHYSELKTINVNPSIAYKLNDQLSVAAGFNAMWSELTLRQHFPWALVTAPLVSPDGLIETEGDGWGYGANLAVTWKINSDHRIAATYKTAQKVDYSGDFLISNVPAAVAPAGFTSRSDFSSSIKFPSIIGLGYGWQISDTVQLETNFEWLQFSNFDTLNLGAGNNAGLFPPGALNIRQAWDDTFTLGIAGDWNFKPNWNLRGSYHYFESPVPDETISTTIPDSNQNALTGGLAYASGNHRCEFSYSYVFYEDRTISNNQNPLLNGSYETTVHLLSASYSYRF
jgi:long-chain fatty acid transport protein